MDTTQNEAVMETQTDTLLAGKYKSKEDLLDATAEIYQKFEGRPMTPSEVLALSNKDNSELESFYKGFERKFHTERPASQETAQEDETYKLLDQYLEQRGYVRKDELARKEYEENELNSYFAQNPEAKNRVDLIRTLANSSQFKDKSFAEVDRFITSQIGRSTTPTTSPTKMGRAKMAPSKSIDEMSDEEFREFMSSGENQTLI